MLAISFIVVSISSLALFYFATGRNKKLLFIFTAWQIIPGALSLAGIFTKKPLLFPAAIIVTVFITVYCLKKINRQQLSVRLLLSIHVLRIPVELTLYQLYLQNKVPKLMTYSGWNFDILVGITALLLLLYMFFTNQKLHRRFFLIWNIAGLLFLLFIVSLAILSSPLPIQLFAFNQPNVGVLQFPYSFLPTCVVPVVLMSHLLLINTIAHPLKKQQLPVKEAAV